MHAKIDTIDPYHQFAGALFRTVAEPGSALNPLSPESAAARDQAMAIFTAVVEGSDARVPRDLEAELPRLLWLYHLGVVLYWIHDSSPDRQRTRRLVDGTADLVASVVRIAGNPLLLPFRKRALRLLHGLREPADRAPDAKARRAIRRGGRLGSLSSLDPQSQQRVTARGVPRG